MKVEDSSTVAFGINVPKALGDFLVLHLHRLLLAGVVRRDDRRAAGRLDADEPR